MATGKEVEALKYSSRTSCGEMTFGECVARPRYRDSLPPTRAAHGRSAHTRDWVSRVLEVVADGRDRMLLTLSTGKISMAF
jgi:hypothetical protein